MRGRETSVLEENYQGEMEHIGLDHFERITQSYTAVHFLFPRQDTLTWLLKGDIFLHFHLTVTPIPWPAAVQEGGLRTCASPPSFPELV